MNATKAHRQILEQVEQYGLKRKRDGSLVPEFVPDGTSMKPSGVPEPCTCPKCAKPNPPASHPATSNS